MKTPRHVRLLQALLCLICLIILDLSTCRAQSPWTQKADMLYSAFEPSVCMLDGKFYVMGGIDRYSTTIRDYALDSVSVYDPELDSWSLLANMPNNRSNFSSCVYNGKILAIGGNRSLYYSPVSAIDIYDPVSDTWSHLTDIPLAANWQPAVILDDKIYVFSGAETTDSDFPYDNLQIYDLLTDTWSEGAKMPTPRYDGSAIALNDKIYVIGGEQGNYLGMNTVEVYDPATDRWSTKADMIFPRKWHSNCLLDSSIYVFGGLSGSCKGWHSGGELYDPEADRWREITPNINLSGPLRIAPHNGKIYVCGGDVSTCNAKHTYDIKSLYLYEPHYDLYPIVKQIGVNKNAVIAGADSVLISTRMHDPTGITLMAKLNTLEGFPIDSIHLFDDGNHNDESAGDSLFANTWYISSAEECQYAFDLEVTRTDADTVINRFNNRAVFTTNRMVTLEGFSLNPDNTNPVPDDNFKFNIDLKNNSKKVLSTNIKVRPYSVDGLVWVISGTTGIQDIAPGESITSNYFYAKIFENCPRDTSVTIAIDISSFDHVFRTDTIRIEITSPEDPEDIEDQAIAPVNIYPNPASNLINIETGQPGQLWIEITSLNGQLIHSEIMDGTTHQLDLSPFRKGVYFITIRSKDFVTTRKIIKL